MKHKFPRERTMQNEVANTKQEKINKKEKQKRKTRKR